MASNRSGSSAPAHSTRERRPRHVRREDIVNAAVKLWSDRGYHATSIADLCAAAGIGKGALYHHFASKEAILVEIFRRVADRMLPSARAIADSDVAPADAMRTLSAEWMDSISRHRGHYAVFFRETDTLTGEQAKAIRADRREFQDIVATHIQRGIDRRDFMETSVELAAMSFIGMHAWAAFWLASSTSNPYRWWAGPSGVPSPAAVSASFCTTFLAGLQRQ